MRIHASPVFAPARAQEKSWQIFMYWFHPRGYWQLHNKVRASSRSRLNEQMSMEEAIELNIEYLSLLLVAFEKAECILVAFSILVTLALGHCHVGVWRGVCIKICMSLGQVWPSLRRSARTPTTKAVRGIVAIEGYKQGPSVPLMRPFIPAMRPSVSTLVPSRSPIRASFNC